MSFRLVGVFCRRPVVVVALGVAATLFALILGRTSFHRTLDWKLYDQHVRWVADPAQARRDIVLVTIDELSLRRLEPAVGRWPWPRLVHASLVDFLARAPARVVAYDVLFTERDTRTGFDVGGETWTGAESDEAFAESVRRASNLVLLADATFEGLVTPIGAPAAPSSVDGDVAGLEAAWPVALDDSFEERPSLALPYPSLAKAARALGHNYLVLDPDGPVRRTVPFVRHAGRFLPSLGVAAFTVAEGVDRASIRLDHDHLVIGRHRVPLLRETLPQFRAASPSAPATGRRLLIPYTGPAVLPDGRTTTYRQYSFYDLFYSEQQLLAGERPFIDPALFRDAIVFVGVTAAGLHDVFTVPIGEGGKMHGSQVHANVVEQLLEDRSLRPAPSWAGAVTALAGGVAGALALLGLPLRQGALAVLLAVLALGGVSLGLFSRGLWLPLVGPLLSTLVAATGGLAYQYLVEGREKRAVKRLFSRYLSKDVYEQVLANPALAELGGSRRDMSVLFSDIRGFTAVTEKGDPEELVAQLNEYFSRMVDLVFANWGTLDKFVGDMVMALFGAPLDDPRHADHAVKTALAMVEELDRLNDKWSREGRPVLGIGIGINSGDMIAGNIGAEKIRSYTVIGDHVNLGARLEALNKDYGTSIIISEHTVRRLEGTYDLRPLGEVVVKGKSVPVAIYEVRPPRPLAHEFREAEPTPAAERRTME